MIGIERQLVVAAARAKSGRSGKIALVGEHKIVQRATRVKVGEQFAQRLVKRQQLGDLHHRLQIECVGGERNFTWHTIVRRQGPHGEIGRRELDAVIGGEGDAAAADFKATDALGAETQKREARALTHQFTRADPSAHVR